MKVKSGFSQYARNKIPLHHPKTWSPPPRTKDNTDPSLGKLLPNGFRVGDRVFYSSYSGERVHGVVVDHERDDVPQSANVWANWRGSRSPSYMPLPAVFHDF